jgi:PAS domain S-box-containing protein
VDFNQAAERTFGYRRAQVVGQTVEETIVPPRFRESHRRGVARFREIGGGNVLGRRIEFPALRSDGSEIPVELAITASRVGGNPVFFTAYLRDISERKRTEQRRALELAVSQVLAQAATSEEALARILQSVCKTLQWSAAAIWTVDPARFYAAGISGAARRRRSRIQASRSAGFQMGIGPAGVGDGPLDLRRG